jgi:hypothetical protein
MRTSLAPTLLRSHAGRYDIAIRAISEIAGMRLEELEQLKQATAIVERQGPDLKFAGHKRLVIARDDATFMASLRQACPDRNAATALANAAKADPNVLLRLKGADVLAVRLRQGILADAMIVNGIARRLREAARQISAVSQPNRTSTRYVAEGFALGGDVYTLGFFGQLFYVPLIGALLFLAALEGPLGAELAECLVMSMCMKKLQGEWAACLAKARKMPPGNRKAERDQAALEARYAADLLSMPMICGNFALRVGTGKTTASPSNFPSFTCYGFPPTGVPIDPAY